MQSMISLSVRELVEFILRGGDIDNRFGGFDRALEGSRIHRKLQKAGGENYRPEVSLALETAFGAYTLRVEGRADGIITDADGVTLDEIKTTAVPAEWIGEDFNPLHWAQAMCYAHFYCVDNQLERIRIRVTYYQIETEEIKRFVREYTAEQLAEFYLDLLEKYHIWAVYKTDWSALRDRTIREQEFPFAAYRRGQREMAVSVYRTVRDGGKLFCQAPTGIGKTISTLFPSVKAIGEGNAEKIFYLTAKTITRQAAEDACVLMRSRGLRMKSVTLTAKEKICFTEQHDCNPDACPYAKGHYDRVNAALYDLLQREDHFTREVIEDCARLHSVCPFEFGLDLTLWADCVICDYNYVFDPQVYLRRFFYGKTGDYVFLVDEAHNLVDRARVMYSAVLMKSEILRMQRALGTKDSLRKLLTRINKAMVAMRKACENTHCNIEETPDPAFIKLLVSFLSAGEEWLKRYPHAPQAEQLLSLYFSVLSFLRTADFYDEHYITLTESKDGDLAYRLLCLDPSYLLAERMKAGKASILFSATLTPLDYFMSVLGGDEESNCRMLPSPFPQENLCLLVNDRISTKYKHREDSLIPIADMVAKTVSARTGNYIVYFPSYAYLKAAVTVFCERYPAIRVIAQQSGMDETERELFLQQFQADNVETLVGFCVLGGIYAEGIDLKGERLIGTVIVGVGLPQLGTVQDILRDYYDRAGGNGFNYAYRYPGMNKVLQAAGRVIRDETDRGVVLLIDDRFTAPAYLSLMPAHWQGIRRVADARELKAQLKAFWRS